MDTCTDNDLQHKVAVLPCITDLWNNKEYAQRDINERCRIQGTQRVPLVSRAGFGVIDRQANFILDALNVSSFLFPIGQQRQPDELVDSVLYLMPFNITLVGTECVIRILLSLLANSFNLTNIRTKLGGMRELFTHYIKLWFNGALVRLLFYLLLSNYFL